MPACYEGWEYDANRTAYHQFYKMVSGTHYWNKTNDNITFTSTFSGTYSKSASASASLGGGWGPINAEVGYTATKTITWSASEAVTATVRPGYEGWIDYGTGRDIWYGKYYYLTSYCSETNSSYITVYSPRTKVAVAKTSPL